jgi:hypothetical protein
VVYLATKLVISKWLSSSTSSLEFYSGKLDLFDCLLAGLVELEFLISPESVCTENRHFFSAVVPIKAIDQYSATDRRCSP